MSVEPTVKGTGTCCSGFTVFLGFFFLPVEKVLEGNTVINNAKKKKSLYPEKKIFSLLFTPSGKNRHEMYVIAHAAKKWSMKKKTVELCFVLFLFFLSVVVF